MERPILFNGPMVRALIDGTKTQTRRPITLRDFGQSMTQGYAWAFRDKRALWNEYRADDFLRLGPFGVAGDRLWVRETWRPVMEGWQSYVEYKAGRPRLDRVSREQIATVRKFAMRFAGADETRNSEAWHPSIHMPKWAARIWLDVVSVRVERLWALTEEDLPAEGIEALDGMFTEADTCLTAKRMGVTIDSGLLLFAMLWDEIYPQTPWVSNPWAWVVTFKRSEGQP